MVGIRRWTFWEGVNGIMSKVLAYARVSTKEQNLDRQKESLKRFVEDPERDIYDDEASGKDTDRDGYKYLKRRLEPGDTLYIHELDRLGRTKAIIKRELDYFKANNITVRILNIPTTMITEDDLKEKGILDVAGQKAVYDLMNNIIIEVLSTFAETEREYIRKRQREGIATAKQKGKHLGRKKIVKPATWTQDMKDWRSGKVTAVALYRDKYHMSRSVFYRFVADDAK